MKRFLILALVAAFVLSAGLASAKEVQMQGQFEFINQWTDNTNLQEKNDKTDQQSEDDFDALQRVRQYFKYVDSENLSGTVGLEMNGNWGNAGYSVGAKTNTVVVKHAYMDFNWPDTALHFRVGKQCLTLPSSVAGNPVLDDDVTGIIASYAINDNVSVVAGWARLYDGNLGTDNLGTSNGNKDDEIDAVALIVPITMDGWSLTPWAVYAMAGKDSTAGVPTGMQGINGTAIQDDLTAYWIGGSFTLTAFDPLNFYADLIYGNIDGGDNGTNNDRDGWFFAAKATYTMDMVTPGVFFAYGSGEDDDPTNGSEAMPLISESFGPTTFGFDGSAMWRASDQVLFQGNDLSVMVIGAGLYNFSFLENMSHDLIVAYGIGTNDSELTKKYGDAGIGNLNSNRGATSDGGMLTEKDSFWEVDFNTTYSLYEALTAYVEFGYIDVDLDKDYHPGIGDLSSAWKLSLGLKYNY